MEELVIVPIAIALVLGLSTQLVDLAEDASERTARYAEDAVLALYSAYTARPLTACAPGITNARFSEEIARTNALLEDLQAGTTTTDSAGR